MDSDRTARARSDWDRMAATYDRSAGAERFLIGDTRARLCGQARGRTLEVAIGTGLNLGLYPPGTDLVALDLSGGMLEIASKRAEHLDGGVTFVQGDAQRMPFADAMFDTVVCTLALCAVPDQSPVVAEIRRVLRPGGRLLLVDHIEYARLPLRLVERWRSRGHTPRRRPLEMVVEAGFDVERHDRLTLGFVDRVVARRSH